MIIENSNLNVIKTLLALQASFNNASTSFIEYSLNELMYELKIKDVLTALTKSAQNEFATITTNITIDFKKIKNAIEYKMIYAKKVANVTTFVNAKAKTYYDKKH